MQTLESWYVLFEIDAAAIAGLWSPRDFHQSLWLPNTTPVKIIGNRSMLFSVLLYHTHEWNLISMDEDGDQKRIKELFYPNL